MSGCEFEHEDFCILQDEHPEAKKCRYAKGELQICTAKESDLIELCPDCENPKSECNCGTCWILATDERGTMAILTPKEFETIKLRES